MKEISIERVKQLFLMLTNLPDQELPRWAGACKRGVKHIESRLKEDAGADADGEELCAAAAGCAYYEYVMLEIQSAKGLSDISIGGVSIKNTPASRTDAVKDARETRDYYLSCCAGLLKNESAIFFAIRGDAYAG